MGKMELQPEELQGQHVGPETKGTSRKRRRRRTKVKGFFRTLWSCISVEDDMFLHDNSGKSSSTPVNRIRRVLSVTAPTRRPVALGDYNLVRVLGAGSFGKVFLAKPSESESLVAIKVLRKSEVLKRKQIQHTLTEKVIMETYSSHPFILGLRDSFQTPDFVCLVSDFASGGELYFHMEKNGAMLENAAKFYSAQVCDALVFLHKRNVLVRDLKSENLLLSADGNIMVADFGLSKCGVSAFKGARTICGSLAYMSPEMIMCHHSQQWRSGTKEYGYMADYWSFGTLLFDLLCGTPPFFHSNKGIMFNRILSNEPVQFPRSIADDISPEAKSLITGLIRRNPRNRICSPEKGGFKALKEHPFFAGIHWEKLRAKELKTPFKPTADSVQNFDATFTNLAIEKALKGGRRSPVSPSEKKQLEAAFEHWDVYNAVAIA